MKHLVRAARLRLLGNLLFLAFILLAIAAFSLAVAGDYAPPLPTLLYIGAALFLVLAAVLVALCRYAAAKHEAQGKAELAEAKAASDDGSAAEPPLEGEEGLSAAFRAEIGGYSVAQLRLILDEQAEEYSAEEFAYIRKVLAKKEAETPS